MKLAAAIYTVKQLNTWIEAIDCPVLNCKEYSLVYQDLNLDTAVKFCKSRGKTPIIAVNRLYHPQEMEEVRRLLIRYQEENVLFLATDLGVAAIAAELKIMDRIIFDPQTMIANALDLKTYAEFGFHSLGMSLEIPFQDVLDSIERTQSSVFYQVFGHRLMFYSRRHLISLYEKQSKLRVSENGLYLREATREDYLPVIENQNGTLIYRSYLISLLKHSEDFSKLAYGYMESLYLSDDTFLKVAEIYSAVVHGEYALEEGLKRIDGLALPIADGFTYQDSVYQKEMF